LADVFDAPLQPTDDASADANSQPTASANIGPNF